MNQERAAAEADVAQGGRGLAKLNPSPRKAYELVLRLKDAPGDFAVVEGVAQYDVINEDQCGHIEPATGTAARITSQEPVQLRKVADGEYRGRDTPYRCHPEICEPLFWPLEQIDRQVRPGAWGYNDPEPS